MFYLALNGLDIKDLTRTKCLRASEIPLQYLKNIAPEEVENQSRLTAFSFLNFDWDGKGGLQFTKKNISFFRNIISSLEIQPELAPTSKGGIYLRYIMPNNTILSFELYKSVMIETIIPNGDYDLLLNRTYDSSFSEVVNEHVKTVAKNIIKFDPVKKDKKQKKNRKN